MITEIYLDLDGVVHGFRAQAIKAMNLSKINADIARECLKYNYDYLEDAYGQKRHDDAVEKGGVTFWKALELFPWSQKIYRHCVKLVGKDNVYFLSSFGKWPAAAGVKAERVKKEFKTNKIILTKFKHLLAAPNRLLIDDKVSNVLDFYNAGGFAFLWPCEFVLYDNPSIIKYYLDFISNYVNPKQRTSSRRKRTVSAN